MRRLKPTPAVALLTLPLLMVGYVLSVGPALRIAQVSPASREPIVTAYVPLFEWTPDWELLTDALLWYLELWGVELTVESYEHGILDEF